MADYISNITVNGVNYKIKDNEVRESLSIANTRLEETQDNLQNHIDDTSVHVTSVKISGNSQEYKSGNEIILPAYPTTLPASDVKDWAKADNKPTYTASEGRALADNTFIPSQLSDLTEDSAHRVVTDTQISTWESKAEVSDIPTQLSELSDSENSRLVTDIQIATWNAKADVSAIPTSASDINAVAASEKGAINGVATLGSDGKIPSSQLPSYVDDVLEYYSKDSFPVSGESGKIYLETSTNKTYRWSGSTYVVIASDLALGETSSTAFAGDRGKALEDNAFIKNATIIWDASTNTMNFS